MSRVRVLTYKRGILSERIFYFVRWLWKIIYHFIATQCPGNHKCGRRAQVPLLWKWCREHYQASLFGDGRQASWLPCSSTVSVLLKDQLYVCVYFTSEQRVRVFGGVCSSIHQSHSQEVHLRESRCENWRGIRKQCFTGERQGGVFQLKTCSE